MINLFCVKLIISTVVAFVFPARTAIAPLWAPFIFSPNIVLESSANPLTKTNLSNTGSAKFTDSNTPTTLYTSGVLRETSISSTLLPYMALDVNPSVATPTLEVLLITMLLLLETFLVLLLIKSFSKVTFITTSALPLRFLMLTCWLLATSCTWLSVRAMWRVSVVDFRETL